jgi:hypothetical protein
MKRNVTFLLLGASLLLNGCGSGGDFPITHVSGTVLCEGKPVAKALVFFEPIRSGDSAAVGDQGFALTDEQGKFVVSTYGENDGAVVGKHLVRVGKSETSPPCDCALNAEKVLKEVEVLAGDAQSFELVLAKKSARNRDQILELDDEE